MIGLFALGTGYVLSQFYRSFMAVLTPILIDELGATKADLSLASGIWFLTFALSQFAVGVCLDKYGPKLTATTFLAIAGGGGAFLFAFAQTPWMVIVAMALIGIGCSPVLMASVFIFARTYSPARFAVLTSWFVGIGSLGNVIGASPLAEAAEAFGWRNVLIGLGVLTIAVSIAIFMFVRDPERHAGVSGDSGFSGYLNLLRMKVLWPIFPMVALGYAAAAGIRGLWAGPYLTDVYAADVLLIGQVTLFMALAMVIGSFVYGPLDTVFGTRKWVALVGNAIGLIALVFLAMNPVSNITVVAICLIVIGMSGSAYGLLMAHGRAFLPAHLTGRGVTLLNFFSIGMAGVMQFITGFIVTEAAVPDAPEAAYQALFWFYAIMLALAIIIYFWAQDAKPERKMA